MDARLRAVQRGKQHWSSAFPHLEAWLTSRPASAGTEPGSEVSSMMGSGDEIIGTTGPLAEDLMVHGNNGVSSSMADAHESLPNTVVATPLSGAATQLTPSTIQSVVVQLSVQDTPGVSGPPLISIPSAAPTAGPLISMRYAAPGNAAHCTHCYTSLAYHVSLPNQMGYIAGAPSNFYPQSNQFPYVANPSWEASQREQLLQNQLLQERQQLKAWIAHQAQPQPQVAQAPPGAFGAYCHC